jgi:hypothetical protein
MKNTPSFSDQQTSPDHGGSDVELPALLVEITVTLT